LQHARAPSLLTYSAEAQPASMQATTWPSFAKS
jgi:hypothetical protein